MPSIIKYYFSFLYVVAVEIGNKCGRQLFLQHQQCMCFYERIVWSHFWAWEEKRYFIILDLEETIVVTLCILQMKKMDP
jgi:hypothetical protein